MDSYNKTKFKTHTTAHDHCISQWVHQRELQNRPQGMLLYNRRYYQKTKERSKSYRAQDLLRERLKNQKNMLINTIRQIDQISFKYRKQEQPIGEYRRMKSFENQQEVFIQQRDIQQTLREEDWEKRVAKIHKYKSYFLQNLQNGHPRYSPYGMLKEPRQRRKLCRNDYLREDPIISRELELRYGHLSPTLRATTVNNQEQLDSTENKRFQSSIKAAQNSSKGNNLSANSKNNQHSSYTKRDYSSPFINNDRKTDYSMSQVKKVLRGHSEEIIEYLMELIKKQGK